MEELWRPISNHPAYEVSSFGRVRRIVGGRGGVVGKILKWHTATSSGYANVRMSTDGISNGINVHKLVCRAFLGPKPDGLVTRHMDGNKLNNNISNLRYGTCLENSRDKHAHGTASGWYKLSPADVIDIRERVLSGEKRKELALIYGVHPSHICGIVNGSRRTTPSKRPEASNRMMDRSTK